MRFPLRMLSLGVLTAAGSVSAAQAQSARLDAAPAAAPRVPDDRFKWSLGVQGGAMFFTTQRQTQSSVPAAGAHISVISRRAGLQLGVEEAFGSDEPTAFVDESSVVREITFDRIRRYGFNLTGYPVRGAVEPYLGVGFGIVQVVDWEFDENEQFASADEAGLATSTANEKSASAFASFLAGLQFRVGRLAAFGQYQIQTAPRAGDLLRGTGMSVMGGLRFSLGSAREDVKSGY